MFTGAVDTGSNVRYCCFHICVNSPSDGSLTCAQFYVQEAPPKWTESLPNSTTGFHYVACGAGANTGRCTEDSILAADTTLHEVQCCSDESQVGWLSATSSCPWAERDAVNMQCVRGWNSEECDGQCNHQATFLQAYRYCHGIPGGRLCTLAETLAGCTAATGCGHDVDLLWTSDVGTL